MTAKTIRDNSLFDDCGAEGQTISGGIAQVVDDMGNPLVLTGDS